jgi:sarcosine oxidase subunit beta
MNRTTDVIVIGAGAVGLSIARELAKRAVGVTVLDRGALAGEASTRNGGQISPFIDGKWAPFARRCLDLWPGLADELGDIAYRPAGGLHVVVADDPVEPDDLIAYRSERGFVAELASPDECARLIPGLTAKIKGGVRSPRHGQVDPFLTMAALARAAQGAGAELLPDTPVDAIAMDGDRVTGVRTPGGPIASERVVIAAGPWGAQVAALAGVDVPVRPRRIQIMRTAPTTRISDGVWSGNGLYSRQDLAGRLHFGAEGPPWDPPAERFENDVSAPTMQRIARRMVELMPALRRLAVERAWSGIIAMTPDLMPIIDALPSPRGLVLATGFGGNGFGTFPAFGEAVAQLIADGRSELDTSPFALARFAHPSLVA